MRGTTVLMAFAFLLIWACKEEKKKETPAVSAVEVLEGWSDEDKTRFSSNCVGFLEAEGVEDSERYCDCLLESSMETYPDVEQAMELEQTEIVSLFEQSECIDELLLVKIEHPWTEEAEALFKKNCKEGKMQQGISDDDAEKYCDCALTEVREIIPNPSHVVSLTEEELTQVFQKCQD